VAAIDLKFTITTECLGYLQRTVFTVRRTYGTTYIYIDTAHVLLVSVGLAQARPNNIR